MANDQSKRLVVDIAARVDKLEKGMARARKVANDNFKGIEKGAGGMVANVNSKLGSIGKEFALGVGGGILAAMAPLLLFQKAISDIGEAAGIKRLADRIGLSTTSLQALQYGAVQVGVAVDQMGDGLGDFAAKVVEAASGAGPLASIFKANGVELKNQDGTLRSTRDILAEFANLIQNAQTPAEQLYLAQQAFGDEAAKMVPLFKDGARGLEQLEVNAQSAGAVIDKDLISRAAELDSRMQSMWQVFAAQSKSALLTAIQGMDGLLARYAQFQKLRAYSEAGSLAGSLVKPKGEVLTTGTGDKPTSLDARMGGTPAAVDPAWLAKFQAAYAPKPTVIPTSGGTGTGAAKGGGGGLKESVGYAEKLIENLEHERDLIGLSGVELEKANALWRAGKDATQAQKDEITALVTSIYSAKEAAEAQKKVMEDIRDSAKDFATTLVDGLLDGKDATEVLHSALKQLASQLAHSGIEALFGGGGAGGGLFAGIGKLLGFAGGTNYAPGGMALVGERGPELVNLPRGSQVLPTPQTIATLRGPVMPRLQAPANQNRPQVVELHVTGNPGPEFIPTIQAHSRDVAVRVTKAGIGAYDRGLDRNIGSKMHTWQLRRG